MSKYRFSLRGADAQREGVIESDSFRNAVDSLADHVQVYKGDLLEIGVTGFPPALFECVGEIKSLPVWMPANSIAA